MTSTCVLSIQVSGNGNVLQSEIVGSVKMRVYLTGMPELRLGLNDKILFETTGRKCTISYGLFFVAIEPALISYW